MIRTTTITGLWNRIYSDFLMPSRLDAYRGLLERALRADYSVISIEGFWELIVGEAVDPARRYLILRHDIDTDPGTAARLWHVEQDLGIEGSFYFRLSTLDIPLMRAIGGGRGYVGYHYEDLASVAKRHRLRNAAEVLEHVPEAQERFRLNLDRLRAMTGLPMRVAASHGDFVNRMVGIPNWEILKDRAFRDEVGVDLEVYDDAFMRQVTSRHSDLIHPRYWAPEDPIAAIERKEPVVYLLVHPRQWHVDRKVNLRDDVKRLEEGLRYWRPGRVSRGRH